MSTARKRVKTGVEWLDRQAPGWEPKINLASLDMGNAQQCVLGQVFADKTADWGSGYRYGRSLVVLNTRVSVTALGFNTADVELPKLQAAWVEVITARRREREYLTKILARLRPRV